EIEDIIKKLKRGKAYGWDKVGNDFYKLCVQVIAPYVAHVALACLRLSYHPERFKYALTVMIPKEGKDSYSDPKNWRPIALLSSLGKIVERVVARRFTDVILEQKLLPESQM
ncbi:hypothetical protein BDV96DRAFT_459837, partial [Lophiotrema nucula]